MSLLDEMSKYPIAMRQAEVRRLGALSNAFFLLATFSDLSGWDTTWVETSKRTVRPPCHVHGHRCRQCGLLRKSFARNEFIFLSWRNLVSNRPACCCRADKSADNTVLQPLQRYHRASHRVEKLYAACDNWRAINCDKLACSVSFFVGVFFCATRPF